MARGRPKLTEISKIQRKIARLEAQIVNLKAKLTELPIDAPKEITWKRNRSKKYVLAVN